MPSRMHYQFLSLAVLVASVSAPAQDLHIKKNIAVGGYTVSSSEISIKGARERTVTQSPSGSTTVSLRQCDLKRTVTLNEQAQTYFVANDPQDEAALKAAALVTGATAADSGGYITETSTVTDTGERKQLYGYPARHLKTTVQMESSANACSTVKESFEIDGWYADVAKEQAGCQHFSPPVPQAEGCHDRIVSRRRGSAKPGYPLMENITMHNADSSTTNVTVNVSEISKQSLEPELFDVPANYKPVNSIAELTATPQAQPQAAANSIAPPQQAQNTKNPAAQNAMLQQAAMAQMSQMGFAPGGPNGGAGRAGGGQPGGSPAATPQALGPKAPGKVRVGIAPPQAQVGQGNNAGDYSTPIRNSIVLLMNGPAVEIAALDSHAPMQVQAEAQQKQCDYVLFSSVTVKHASSGGFGRFAKMAGPLASMTPMGAMAHGMGGAMAAQAAGAAASAAAMSAQQQAMSQLAGFNNQIKSKDDVAVQYQLYPTGQDKPLLQNSLQGKAKSDGEDVLTPLIEQTASTVLAQVAKK
jgi:hypothetical protein